MKKIFLLIVTLLFCGKLFAAGIDEIVFFGDSLSDNGNLYNLLKVIPRSPPYYNGRFTNGRTWAETLGNHYQDANGIAYSIYAYGGATTFAHGSSGIFAMNLESEVLEFYGNTALADKSKKLYVIWIGANDYLWEDEANADTLTTQVIDNFIWTLNDLKNNGARYFLILNVPDLAKTPYAELNNVGDRLRLMTELHNTKLAKALANFTAENPAVKLISINTYNIFNDLIAHTDQFNQKYKTSLSVLNQACWSGGITLRPRSLQAPQALNAMLQQELLTKNNSLTLKYNSRALVDQLLSSPSLREAYRVGNLKEANDDPCEKPEQYIFWDLIHPTVVVHQILAALVLETLELEAKDWFIG